MVPAANWLFTQWCAVMKNGEGKRSVLMSVPEHRYAPPPSWKLMRATDFLRSAIAVSSAASPVLHAVEMVHDDADLANGEAVKWTIAPTRTAPGSSAVAENTSIICSEPSVHGVHASLVCAGSTRIDSTRPSLPCARTSMGAVTFASSSFTRNPSAPSDAVCTRATKPPATGVHESIAADFASGRTVPTRSGSTALEGAAASDFCSALIAGSEILSDAAIAGALNRAGDADFSAANAREGISPVGAATVARQAAQVATARSRIIMVFTSNFMGL